jgi:hypothetical protein
MPDLKDAMLSTDLQDVLVCPVCNGALQGDDKLQVLCCLPCGLAFPVRDGIPVMLPGEARKTSGLTPDGQPE